MLYGQQRLKREPRMQPRRVVQHHARRAVAQSRRIARRHWRILGSAARRRRRRLLLKQRVRERERRRCLATETRGGHPARLEELVAAVGELRG